MAPQVGKPLTLLRTLVPRYRFANATAALTAVPPGGNPLGAASRREDRTADAPTSLPLR
ncbi:hypothetical protein GS682_14755 [Nostoc sp. B(2019)]|nr:hypothetical protein [Nostoc sp. B(2019)]